MASPCRLLVYSRKVGNKRFGNLLGSRAKIENFADVNSTALQALVAARIWADLRDRRLNVPRTV